MGMPLQYILGSQPFGKLDVKCTKDVLIPRWETEEWSIKLANTLKTIPKGKVDGGLQELRVMDICTGTGCIALTMKAELNCAVTGVDISAAAIRLSRENATRNQLEVEFQLGDVFAMEPVACDLITANPPYISLEEYTELEPTVREFEPKLALVGGDEFYEALVKMALRSGAEGFVFELGDEGQYQFTKGALPGNWTCKLYIDGAGKARCAVGWLRDGKLDVLEQL